MIRRLTMLSLISCLLSAPASAQTVYVRNQPFRGKTVGQGKDLQGSLKDLAGAVNLEAKQTDSGWVVGTPPASVDAKGVWVNGTEVPAQELNGEELVNLEQFASAAGLRYVYNKALGTVDISLGARALSKTAALGAPANPYLATSTPGKPIEINLDHPGRVVDIDSLAEPGKLTLVLVYHFGYPDKGYESIIRGVDVLAQNPDVHLYKVNMGYAGSPAWSAYPQASPGNPSLLIYSRNRTLFAIRNGHSILAEISNPKGFLQTNIEKSKESYDRNYFKGSRI